MADDNKPIKYMRYAIGEIILIVIGILIALSINNWNTQRKYKSLESSMLNEIIINLEESLREVNWVTQGNEAGLKSLTLLLNHIDNDLPFNQNLEESFNEMTYWRTPKLNYTSYETLTTLGTKLISNESLKIKLINIFDYQLSFLETGFFKLQWDYNISVSQPFLSKHLEQDIKSHTAKPNNYNELKKNVEFKNILKQLIYMRSGGVEETKRIGLNLENLIKEVNKEVEKLNNNK